MKWGVFMLNVSDTAKKMMLLIGIIFIIALVIGSLVYRDFAKIMPYAAGLSFGTLFAILKVILLEKSISKAIDMDSKQAQGYASLAFILRFSATAVLLVVSALNPSIDLWGTIIGILSLQVSAYGVNFLLLREDKRKEQS